MATLVFSAIGTALGGPLGGALGALVGNQLDQAIGGSPKREGPRLKELAVTTSSYGTAIARHYGRIRAPGTIIWSTDLVETKEKSGGGKGKPSVTSFNYTISFAVALASRPIKGVGRIWADGNLLRGAAGDLKVGGALRIYRGFGDQPRDPLIASAKGAACPAFRNLAYCVFEGLHLADFGNRIPGLTFEVIADDGQVSLQQLARAAGAEIVVSRPLDDLQGFTDEGGALASSLAAIDQVYPMACDASGRALTLFAADVIPSDVITLPNPAAALDGDSFGPRSGETRRRHAAAKDTADGVRYYDTERDFQAGLQRADGRARPGRSRVLEFPGALAAATARRLANAAADRSGWAKESLAWRIAEVDPDLSPGQIVLVPGHAGYWRIDSWEWRHSGLELDLRRMPPVAGKRPVADAGAALPAADKVPSATTLHAFELPWDGEGSSGQHRVYAAVSSAGAGWSGAALYSAADDALTYLQSSGRERSIIGHLAAPLPAAAPTLLDRSAELQIILSSDDFILDHATVQQLAGGANRALVNDEIIQFAAAQRLSGSTWSVSGLLRGRAGTEGAAARGHPENAAFVLLDGSPLLLETPAGELNPAAEIAAIGLADTGPVLAPILNRGLGRRPLHPVHGRAVPALDGGVYLGWTRRARGSWAWLDGQEVPLNEESERYEVGIGSTSVPLKIWQTESTGLSIPAATWAQLCTEHPGQAIWVRQIGTHGASFALTLTILP